MFDDYFRVAGARGPGLLGIRSNHLAKGICPWPSGCLDRQLPQKDTIINPFALCDALVR